MELSDVVLALVGIISAITGGVVKPSKPSNQRRIKCQMQED
jgi:hypothetical protein